MDFTAGETLFHGASKSTEADVTAWMKNLDDFWKVAKKVVEVEDDVKVSCFVKHRVEGESG